MFRKLAISILTVLSVFAFVTSAVFASPYGANPYGNDKYGALSTPTPTLVPTSTPSNNSGGGSSSNTSGSSSNNSGNQICTDTPPSHAPSLYQIDRKGDTATLFFAPAGNPYNKYVVVYGFSEADERYAVSFDQSSAKGALKYTVTHLAPKTVYYFKVRGGYGCSSGAWSNSMWVGTVGTKSVSFYPSKKTIISAVYSTIKNIQTKVTKPQPNITVAPQTPAHDVQQSSIAQPKQSTQVTRNTQSQSAPQSLWIKVINFFTGK